MLAVPIYYVVFGAIAMALGFLAFKIWDKSQSKEIVERLSDGNWLASSSLSINSETELSQQDFYDFAQQYTGVLRGAFANPTKRQLELLSSYLAAPHNNHRELWPELGRGLMETHKRYKIEYKMLLTTIAQKSSNPEQLMAAYQMANYMAVSTSQIKRAQAEIEKSPYFAGS